MRTAGFQVEANLLQSMVRNLQIKKEGGSGIRNIEAINKALILNAVWKIVTLPDSSTTKILKAKYFHNTSFWKANPRLPKSAFWASILKVKDQLEDATTYQFSKGKTCI